MFFHVKPPGYNTLTIKGTIPKTFGFVFQGVEVTEKPRATVSTGTAVMPATQHQIPFDSLSQMLGFFSIPQAVSQNLGLS